MYINEVSESPLELKISFNKLLEYYENLVDNDYEYTEARAKKVLKTAK